MIKLFALEKNSSCVVGRTCFEFLADILAGIETAEIKLNTIGAKVRKFRLQKGWSQQQLAQAMQLKLWDTSRDAVTRLENDNRRIGCWELWLVAECLGVQTNDLYPPKIALTDIKRVTAFRLRLAHGRLRSD